MRATCRWRWEPQEGKPQRWWCWRPASLQVSGYQLLCGQSPDALDLQSVPDSEPQLTHSEVGFMGALPAHACFNALLSLSRNSSRVQQGPHWGCKF